MTLDLTGVECFVAVARFRHFGEAATHLGVSVSTVTKRLQRLEVALGVPLVVRDSTGFQGLTPAGSRFVQLAPELVRAAQVATDLAVGEPVSTLHVAVPDGVGVVAPLLPAALGTLEVESTRLSSLHRVGLVGATHPFARRGSVPATEFAEQRMLYTPGLPDHYMHPFILADVRPLDGARLVPISATTTAHVAQRILVGREVTTVPIALTANLPPELHRVLLRGLPDSWYFAHHRAADTRPELHTALGLMGDFTASINRAALP